MSHVKFIFQVGISSLDSFHLRIKEKNQVILDKDVSSFYEINLKKNVLYSVQIYAYHSVDPKCINQVIQPKEDCEIYTYPYYLMNRSNKHLVHFILTDRYYENLPIEKGMIYLGNL